jgi:hypothetical protein
MELPGSLFHQLRYKCTVKPHCVEVLKSKRLIILLRNSDNHGWD